MIITDSLSGNKYTYPFGIALGKNQRYFMVLDRDNTTPPVKDLKVEAKWFTIFTMPLGALLTIDSIPTGVTPFTGSLTMGKHNLKMDLEGEVKTQEIDVNEELLPVIYTTFTGEGKPEKQSRELINLEEQPQFPGGEKSMMKFLKDHLQYPIKALENGITGTVFLQFKVDRTGKISDIKVLRGIGGGCDEEAIRVVKRMPAWKPGILGGQTADCYFTLPIRFNTVIVNSINSFRKF